MNARILLLVIACTNALSLAGTTAMRLLLSSGYL
jgi:hypothetical protein